MLNRLLLKVTKFQLPPAKRLSTVVKNILRGHQFEEVAVNMALFRIGGRNIQFSQVVP